MVARSSSVRFPVSAGSAFPFGLASGQIEFLKWLAFALMINAHWFRHVLGGTDGWPIDLGRVCFPIFALCVAVPLARDVQARGARVAFSLFWLALAAQVVAQPMRAGPSLNVLFQFLAAGAWLGAGGMEAWSRWCVRALALFVGFLAEFSWPGLALIVCLTRAYERQSLAWAGAALVAFCLSQWLEQNPWGFAVFFVVPLVAWTRIGVRQFRGLFPRMYAAQYCVFWIARAFI